jgi:four helix bundle protein
LQNLHCLLLSPLEKLTKHVARGLRWLRGVVDRLEDLVAYQFAVEFKLEVYRLVEATGAARQDLRFKSQLCDAASGVEACIAEGFARRQPGEFAQFLRYALASLKEAEARLTDGIHRRYFERAACDSALTWARRCRAATEPLRISQLRRAGELRRRKRGEKNWEVLGDKDHEVRVNKRREGSGDKDHEVDKGREVRGDKNRKGRGGQINTK